MEFVVDEVLLGADFLLELRFPWRVLIPPDVPHLIYSGLGTVDPLEAGVSSGLSYTPPDELKKVVDCNLEINTMVVGTLLF
jgi:hypothetical protein